MSLKNPVILAVEEINAKGGIKGIPIEAIFEDDGANELIIDNDPNGRLSWTDEEEDDAYSSRHNRHGFRGFGNLFL